MQISLLATCPAKYSNNISQSSIYLLREPSHGSSLTRTTTRIKSGEAPTCKGEPIWNHANPIEMKVHCSYECNISYADIVRSILHQCFSLGRWTEACFASSTGCPSIALLLGAAHPLRGHFEPKLNPHRVTSFIP